MKTNFLDSLSPHPWRPLSGLSRSMRQLLSPAGRFSVPLRPQYDETALPRCHVDPQHRGIARDRTHTRPSRRPRFAHPTSLQRSDRTDVLPGVLKTNLQQSRDRIVFYFCWCLDVDFFCCCVCSLCLVAVVCVDCSHCLFCLRFNFVGLPVWWGLYLHLFINLRIELHRNWSIFWCFWCQLLVWYLPVFAYAWSSFVLSMDLLSFPESAVIGFGLLLLFCLWYSTRPCVIPPKPVVLNYVLGPTVCSLPFDFFFWTYVFLFAAS